MNLPNHTRPDRGLTRYGKLTIASVDYVSPTAELDRDSTSKEPYFFDCDCFANCCLLVVSAAGCFALFVTGIFLASLVWSGASGEKAAYTTMTAEVQPAYGHDMGDQDMEEKQEDLKGSTCQDPFGDEENAEVKYKVLNWW